MRDSNHISFGRVDLSRPNTSAGTFYSASERDRQNSDRQDEAVDVSADAADGTDQSQHRPCQLPCRGACSGRLTGARCLGNEKRPQRATTGAGSDGRGGFRGASGGRERCREEVPRFGPSIGIAWWHSDFPSGSRAFASSPRRVVQMSYADDKPLPRGPGRPHRFRRRSLPCGSFKPR
jgi:hypothetical protein